VPGSDRPSPGPVAYPATGHASDMDHPAEGDTADPGTAAAPSQPRRSRDPLEEIPDIHRLLVESVRDYAIFILDAEGYVRTWNPGALRLKGYTADEIIGRHFSIFYPPEEARRGHPEHELEAAAAEGRYQEEGWRVRQDGTRFWANVLITALRSEDGALIGFAKVTRDLTERKEAEESLRRSEERFRLLVQGVQDYGIFMLDPDGTIAGWNEGARRIKGYEADEIVGRHFSVFYPEEDLARGKPAMELEVAARDGRFEDEGWRLRKDGGRFWANVSIIALRNDAGEVMGFAKVTRDLTDRRAAELRAIEDARKVARAEAASRAKSELLAVLSHELRTPLTSIGAYVDILAFGIQGPLTEPQREALERIRQGHRHLSMLVTDLLNFGMVQAGRITFRIAQVRLADVAEAVRPLTDPLAYERGVEVEWQEPDEAVVAHGDAARLQQILVNLVTNAIKYNDPGGSVRVRHLVRDGKAVLEVADTGPGIPAEDVEAIFEPFTQLGRSLTSTHEGTGLGLAISRQLARGMGGELGVRSAVGEGSTFVLSVPLAP